MHLSSISLSILAAMAAITTTAATKAAKGTHEAANRVTFISEDETNRTIVFTPSVGHDELPDLYIIGHATEDVFFPYGWVGNWYSVSDGGKRVTGMLGEITFQGSDGATFFDVSAIEAPDDHDGVSEMWPAESGWPISGCVKFPCDNTYYLPDDVQTKATAENHLVATLGRNRKGSENMWPDAKGDDDDDDDGKWKGDDDGDDGQWKGDDDGDDGQWKGDGEWKRKRKRDYEWKGDYKWKGDREYEWNWEHGNDGDEGEKTIKRRAVRREATSNYPHRYVGVGQ